VREIVAVGIGAVAIPEEPHSGEGFIRQLIEEAVAEVIVMP
jgi:hypothetical protein